LQVAVSLVLLVGTGLFVRTLGNLRQIDPGFNRAGLVLFKIDAVSAGYTVDRILDLQARLQASMARLPGVRMATYSNVALLSRVRQNKRIRVIGCQAASDAPNNVNTNGLAPNFFQAMELPIVLGRSFTESDSADSAPVAVVNQAFTRIYCGGQSPVGRQLTLGPLPNDSLEQNIEIVGVAADAKYTDLRSVAPPTVYFPARQRVDGEANFAVRVASGGADASVYQSIRAAVRAIDPALPVLNLRTQDEQIDRLNGQETLFARLSGLFGLLAMALAAVGLYGLMSHAVLRRTGEIGLRMALGAPPGEVLRMILRQSLTLVGIGIIIGGAAAYGAAQSISTMLFGLTPGDPLTYVAVAVALAVTAALAASVPARRASRIDPMTALKVE
jgi:predicted permease